MNAWVMGMLKTWWRHHQAPSAAIRIAGLGILQVRKRPARMGRNPATGEAIKIKASKKVAFRAAKDLRKRCRLGERSASQHHRHVEILLLGVADARPNLHLLLQRRVRCRQHDECICRGGRIFQERGQPGPAGSARAPRAEITGPDVGLVGLRPRRP
jgi:hypothetical protein